MIRRLAAGAAAAACLPWTALAVAVQALAPDPYAGLSPALVAWINGEGEHPGLTDTDPIDLAA